MDLSLILRKVERRFGSNVVDMFDRLGATQVEHGNTRRATDGPWMYSSRLPYSSRRLVHRIGIQHAHHERRERNGVWRQKVQKV